MESGLDSSFWTFPNPMSSSDWSAWGKEFSWETERVKRGETVKPKGF
jgi:hypothetical protein